MIFKIYDCDFGVKVEGVAYDFEHVDSLTITDPERTKLTRGANASNKVGLVYKEGIKEPKTWEIPILNMSLALKELLDRVYEKKIRVETYCIDRNDGSSKMAKNAILSQQPQQLSVTDSPDSMQVSLAFESFDLKENHKS